MRSVRAAVTPPPSRLADVIVGKSFVSGLRMAIPPRACAENIPRRSSAWATAMKRDNEDEGGRERARLRNCGACQQPASCPLDSHLHSSFVGSAPTVVRNPSNIYPCPDSGFSSPPLSRYWTPSLAVPATHLPRLVSVFFLPPTYRAQTFLQFPPQLSVAHHGGSNNKPKSVRPTHPILLTLTLW